MDVSRIRGAGCVARELPAANNTCLSTNERRTVWFFFEVQPLAGGNATPGSPAGKLRFRIVPADASAFVSDDDNGSTPAGMTDYDFALFDISAFNNRVDACGAIKYASSGSTAGSIQKACNYSGLPGPTGLTSQGDAVSVDYNRFNMPVSVTVGQTFALAVDNFSLNASHFTIDFGVQWQAGEAQTASIAPQAGPMGSMVQASTLGGCRNAIALHLAKAVVADSTLTAKFIVYANGQAYQPSLVTDANPTQTLALETKKLHLFFPTEIPQGQFALELRETLADRYQTTVMRGNTPLDTRAPIGLLTAQNAYCYGGKVLVEALRPMPATQFRHWNTNSDVLSADNGSVLFVHRARQNQLLPISYVYSTIGGCLDSALLDVPIFTVPGAPLLALIGQDTMMASGDFEEYDWMRGDSLLDSHGAKLHANQPGVYKVRGRNGPCAGEWSGRFAYGLTSVKRIADISISIYPNPAREQLYIDVQQDGHSERVRIEIRNTGGKLMLEDSFCANHGLSKRALRLPKLGTGLYTVTVHTATAMSTHRVLIR